MREMGVRGVLVYCADHHCSLSVAMSADRRPDEIAAASSRDDLLPILVFAAARIASLLCKGFFAQP
jgi:hypothetical protein